MISAILYSIGSACFGVAFVKSVGSKLRVLLQKRFEAKIFKIDNTESIKKPSIRPKYIRIKPFDCEMCMGWWSGIASGIYFVKDPVEVIYIGAMSFVLAVAITKHLNR